MAAWRRPWLSMSISRGSMTGELMAAPPARPTPAIDPLYGSLAGGHECSVNIATCW